MRGGVGWRLLQSDFPPRSTVLRWFCRFHDECLFEKLNHGLLMLDRQLCGREALPMASIIESQSVKARENGGSRGYNAGKRIKGRSELGSGVDWRDVEAQPRLQRASRGRRAVGRRRWEWQPMSRNGGKLKLR
jgi:hypothetical protein